MRRRFVRERDAVKHFFNLGIIGRMHGSLDNSRGPVPSGLRNHEAMLGNKMAGCIPPYLFANLRTKDTAWSDVDAQLCLGEFSKIRRGEQAIEFGGDWRHHLVCLSQQFRDARYVHDAQSIMQYLMCEDVRTWDDAPALVPKEVTMPPTVLLASESRRAHGELHA